MNNEDRLDRAEDAIENGDFRAAIIDTKDVLRREPDNLRGRLLLGQASIAVGDGAAAEKEFQWAVELGTPFEDIAVDLARALTQQQKYQQLLDQIALDVAQSEDDRATLNQLYGEAHLGLERPVEAREHFNAVLESDLDSVDAKLGIVASFEAERNFIQAQATLDEIVIAHPDDVRGWISSGRLNIRLRNLESAEANFDVGVGLAEEQSDYTALIQSLAGLADTLLAQGKNDRGRDVVERLVSAAPNDLLAILLEARIAYLDKDWSKAQQNLQRVLQMSPDHQSAKMLLGSVHIESGNLEQAEMYLSSVVAAAPDNAEARRSLAEARLLQQKMAAAQEALRPLITGSNTDARSLSMAASASVGLGDFDNAIGYLEKSIEANPGNPELQFQLVTTFLTAGRNGDAERVLSQMNVGDASEDEFRRGALLVLTKMRDGDMQAALTSARSATEKWPDNASALNLLGYVQMTMSDQAGARISFETGAKLSSNSIASRRYLAALEEAEGNLDAARDHYLAVMNEQPEATWAMFSLARLAARDNNSDASIEWLEKLRATDTRAIAPRAILAGLYVVGRDFDSAKVVVDEAIGLDDSNAALHNLLGLVYLNQQEIRSAVASFRRATEIEQANADYRLNLAKAQDQVGHKTQAMQTLASSMEESLLHIPSAVALASMKVEKGDLAGAMVVAERLQEIHPRSPVPHALAAEVHVRGGDLLAASKAYDQALNSAVTRTHALRSFVIKNELGLADVRRPLEMFLADRPLDNEVRIELAESYRRDAEIRKSIDEYEKVLSSEPNNAIALNNLAWVYFEAGNSEAEMLARKAYGFLPEHGSVIDTLGWILVNKGSVDEGVDLLRRANDFTGGRAEVRFHLAAALLRSGQEDEARELLEQVLSTDETFASRDEAQRQLAKLQ